MKTLLKLLYLGLAFGLGTWLSVWVIVRINQPAEPGGEGSGAAAHAEDNPVRPVAEWLENTRHQALHFHQTEHREYPDAATQASCLTCHHPLPHRKDRARRSFLNQHGRFMSCLVCHLSLGERAQVGYAWSSFGKSLPKGTLPYGIRRREDGGLSGQQNLVTHIVPVRKDGAREELFESYLDEPYVEFRENLAQGRPVDKEALRRHAERWVGGPALTCLNCHQDGSVLPLASLGFSPGRIRELENSSAVTMVESRETFQFTPLD